MSAISPQAQTRTLRPWIVGIAIVFACMAAVYGWIAYKTAIHYQNMAATNDVLCALVQYMERHAGELPASEEAFLEAPFIEQLEDGSFRVKLLKATENVSRVIGWPVRDLARFRIRWGYDLSALELLGDHVVHRKTGEPVRIMCSALDGEDGESQTRCIVKIGAKLRQARIAESDSTASQPQ